MITWNYRVFREGDGDYIIREVFYDENGAILGCTANAVEPIGQSLEGLAEDVESFQEALRLLVLTLAEMPPEPKERRVRDRTKNRSLDEVLRELEDDPAPIRQRS